MECGSDIGGLDPTDALVPPRGRTREEGADTSVAAPLLYMNFPHECVSVTSSLCIGRDPSFSPLAESLGAFPKVSKRHAEIKLIGGKFVLTDLNSTNGTFVNGRRLAPGETIELANQMTLRFSTFLEVSTVLQDT